MKENPQRVAAIGKNQKLLLRKNARHFHFGLTIPKLR